jgi:hypothetical protein
MVERTTMNWFRVSNQKGAPRVIAIAVRSHPATANSRLNPENEVE